MEFGDRTLDVARLKKTVTIISNGLILGIIPRSVHFQDKYPENF